MKGFDIVFNGIEKTIVAEYEFLLIHINKLYSNEDATICVYGVDYEMHIRKYWFCDVPIKVNDIIHIKMCEINNETSPEKEVLDKNIRRLDSKVKLKAFYELENYLKEKGLL